MNLDLQVKDNFLPKELFEKLSVYCINLEYSSKNIIYKGKNYDEHIFLSNPIYKDDKLLQDLEKSIIKHFKLKIKNLNIAAFTCVNT